MQTKFQQLIDYAEARIVEPSTWQGVAFLLTLLGSKYANLDWGQAASAGAAVSAILKIIFPDKKDST
jgi:hypothetical protein